MSTAIRRALYGRLSGDTTLSNLLGVAAAGYTKGIYYQQAPPDAKYPLMVFNKQSGIPTQAFHDPDAMDTDLWLIKAIDQNTTADTAEAIQSRAQFLLNDAVLTISGATLLFLRRESDVEYSEVTDGVTYRHAGALYRLVTQ